jgi:hypothetical protein
LARLIAPDGLAHLEAFELGMPEIEGLVVAGAAMRGAESFGVGPRFESQATVPDSVRCIECVAFRLGPLEEMELDEAGRLVETTVARWPDMLESGFRPFSDAEPVHGINIR